MVLLLEELQVRVLTDGCIGHDTVGCVGLLGIIREILCGTSTALEGLQVRVLTDNCIVLDTVVCFDMAYQGNLACGTSTVGITGKSVD